MQADQERDHQAASSRRRIRHERRLDRFADRQSQIARQERPHKKSLRAVQEISQDRGQKSLRPGACLRNEVHPWFSRFIIPRALTLGNIWTRRSTNLARLPRCAIAAISPSAWRSKPIWSAKRAVAGRTASRVNHPGDGDHLRRLATSSARDSTPLRRSSNTSHEAQHRLDAYQGLSRSQLARAARTSTKTCSKTLSPPTRAIVATRRFCETLPRRSHDWSAA